MEPRTRHDDEQLSRRAATFPGFMAPSRHPAPATDPSQNPYEDSEVIASSRCYGLALVTFIRK
ncbi:MAG TPA: hypothetical protein VFR96_17250 [Povalibacter sp.]|nr:hypothetical protein [Povalibacter sp.]